MKSRTVNLKPQRPPFHLELESTAVADAHLLIGGLKKHLDVL